MLERLLVHKASDLAKGWQFWGRAGVGAEPTMGRRDADAPPKRRPGTTGPGCTRSCSRDVAQVTREHHCVSGTCVPAHRLWKKPPTAAGVIVNVTVSSSQQR